MQPFSYHHANTLRDATGLLAEPASLALGGGTDLLVWLKEGLAAPRSLVDLRDVDGLRGIDLRPDGSLRIGAATRIDDLATNALVLERWPVLAAACESVGTSALRHMGTIGGNLCQRPRCWYLRRNIPCLKNGGSSCPAATGENQYHAILGGGPCWIVHPSDPAVALTALGAVVSLGSATGSRDVPIEEFYVLPSERMEHETILTVGEVVIGITLPSESARGVQRYYKLMQRASWDFAIASLGVARRASGDVRLVLGGVAPRPWRIDSSVEEDVASGSLDEADAETLADRALYDAAPLSKNGYKVALARTLIARAIVELIRS